MRRDGVVATCLLLLVLASTACRINIDPRALDDAGLPDAPDAPDGYFRISGTVTGLVGPGLVVRNNGGDDLPLALDGAFTFVMALMDGQPYAVTVSALPSGRDCQVVNASGIVAGAPISSVDVSCYPVGSCPGSPLTFLTSGTFRVPVGCTTITVHARGSGGAGGAKNAGDAAAAGGSGGDAVATFSGLAEGGVFAIDVGRGGTCGSTTSSPGGYAGGGGGTSGGSGNGKVGAGASAPPGGLGGAGSVGTQPGGAGGDGGYGGGGGGGGGDMKVGNSGGGATAFRLASPVTDYLVAGGGGGAGTADQNGDIAGTGGVACNGYLGADGQAAVAGSRSGGGGGGGACFCLGGTCDTPPTSGGAAGGIAGTTSGCAAAQNGAAGRVVISFP